MNITFRKTNPQTPSGSAYAGSSNKEVSKTEEQDQISSIPSLSVILQKKLSSIKVEIQHFRASLEFYNKAYEEMKAATES